MAMFNMSRKNKTVSTFWERIHPLNPRNMNALAASWFICTVVGLFYYGLTAVLPLIYADYSAWVLSAHTMFSYFIFAEMMINWVCMRLLDSTYSPQRHSVLTGPYSEGRFANRGEQLHFLPEKEAPNGTEIHRNASSHGNVNKKNDFLIKIPDYNGEIKDTSKLYYPYWSWKPCLECDAQRPPRTHHCPICRKCILKRDHHCFFTGTCIGLYNQRHFVVFVFWTILSTTYCLIHLLIYLFIDLVPRNSWWDVLYPVTFVRWVAGYVDFMDNILILLIYSVIFFWLTSIGLFIEQISNIRKGLTEFENDNNIKVVSTLTYEGRFHSVFGPHWKYNFIFPVHFWYKTPEDGIVWSHVKM